MLDLIDYISFLDNDNGFTFREVNQSIFDTMPMKSCASQGYTMECSTLIIRFCQFNDGNLFEL